MASVTNHFGEDITKFYIDGENGDDSNDGLSASGSRGVGPWKTIQYAFDKIVAGGPNTPVDGDVIHIMKTSNDSLYYGQSAGHASSGGLTGASWSSKEILFMGANSSGVIDHTVVEIHGGSLDNNTSILSFNHNTADQTHFSNLKFDGGGTAKNCVEATTNNIHGINWVNCRYTNAYSDGVNTNSNANYWNFVNCRFDNNGGAGISHDDSHFSIYHQCLFDNNGARGAHLGQFARLSGCIFSKNAEDGAYIHNNAAVVCDCIFDGNTGDGLWISGGNQGIFLNNIYSNNGDYGLKISNNTECRHYNVAFYNNAGGTAEEVAGSDTNGILFDYVSGSDPGYADPDNLDYTLSGSFNGIGAGVNTHYKMFGNTADDIGVGKWRDIEKVSIF